MLMNDLEQIARRDFAKYLYDKYYQYSQDAVPEFDTLTEYDNYNQSLDKFKIQIPFSTDKEARLEMTELIQDPEFREAWANYSRDDSILDTLYFGPEEVYRVGYLAAMDRMGDYGTEHDIRSWLDKGNDPNKNIQSFSRYSEPFDLTKPMDSYSALQNSLKEGLQDTVVDNMEIDGLDSFPAGFSGYLDLKRFAVEDTYDFEEEEYKATPRENAYSFADTLFDPEFIRKSQRSEEDFYYYDDAYSFTKEYKEGKSLADIVPRAICSRTDLDNVLYEARLKVLKESNHLPADLAEKIAEGITEDADPIIISGDFQGADLSGIDFPEKITFRNCDFENCNLEGVHMAELSGSNLKNANIKNLVARSYVNNDDREAFNKGNILGCYTYADPTREQIKEWDAFHVKKRETRMYQEICQDIAADMNRNGWIIREQEPKRKQKIPGVSVRFCPGGSELQEALAQGVFREARNNFNALCLEVGVSNKGLKLLAREIQQDFLEGRCTPEQILRKSEQGAYSIESMRSAVRSVTIQDVSPKGRE